MNPAARFCKDISFPLQARPGDRPARFNRLRQDHPGQPAAALLRIHQRTISCWTASSSNDYPRRYLRRQIGIVEQEPFLFSRSIRENITYGVGREVDRGRNRSCRPRRRHPRCDPVLSRRATTPWLAKKGSPSPAGRNSAWPLPAPCSKTRAS